ncbi:MAG: heavy metal translocating P-type ATPase, partial [Candidatus Coproplasma sp.]
MIDKVIKIQGLDCANCARELEEEISKIEGVEKVCVDFMASKVIITCAESALDPVLYCINHFEEVSVVEDTQPQTEELFRGGKRIKIANLCCANCARELEEELNGLDGVSATVDFMNMTVILNAQTKAAHDEAIYHISHFEDVKIVDGKPEKKGVFKENLADIISIIVSVAFFIPALVLDLLKFEGWVRYLDYALYGVAFLSSGYIVLWNTVRNIAKGKIFDENFLMAIASIGAIVLGITTGDGLFEGVAVMLLYRIGELLQSIAVGASRQSITKLMDLKSDTATLIKDGEQIIVDPESLIVGDIIMIKAGEKIPVDCRICEGQSTLD